jgi:hypothetical protein
VPRLKTRLINPIARAVEKQAETERRSVRNSFFMAVSLKTDYDNA